MRIAILWYGLTGYLNACLKALAAYPEVKLFVAHKRAHSQAPYDEAQFGWIADHYYWHSDDELAGLRARIDEFRPDVIITVGWMVKGYMSISRAYAGRAIRIMSMDNNWLNTRKQRLGALMAPFYLRPYADAAWVPGERQSHFARRMGFHQENIIRGLYCCDHDAFASAFKTRISSGKELPRKFLFVGRLAEEKGINVLVSAYEAYRSRTADPWPLICCGTGPLKSAIANRPGIQEEGFVQPSDLPKKFAEAGCFLLPSQFEPWGVVVHEAASAGLIILASERVGATPHLVQYNYNGYIFEPDSPGALTDLMVRVSAMSDTKLAMMSSASYSLSQQFIPARWAESLIDFASQKLSKMRSLEMDSVKSIEWKAANMSPQGSYHPGPERGNS